MKLILLGLLGMSLAALPSSPTKPIQVPVQGPWLQLIGADKAFSETSATIGQHDAEALSFADNALVNDTISDSPQGILTWEPSNAEISGDGTFGYTVGLWKYRTQPGKTPIQVGNYVSVWEKQSDNQWKVIASFRNECPNGYHPEPLTRVAPASRIFPGIDFQSEQKKLLEIERNFGDTALRNPEIAYKPLLAKDAKLLRPDVYPVTGKPAILAALSSQSFSLQMTPQRAEVAPSGGLGLTTGDENLTQPSLGSALSQRFTYLRIWRREADGQWRIVIDIMNRWSHPK